MKEIAPAIIEKAEKAMDVNLEEYSIKQMKTKWGTCKIEEKRIRLSLELAKKSIQSLEYVIIHEMVHFLERRHNEKFLLYTDKFLPQWKFYKEE